MKNISKKKATKWELYLYYLKNVIGIVKGLLIIPLYLTFINNELYGAWLASGSILVWIQMFDPGTGDILKQRVAYEYSRNDKTQMGLYIGTGIVIILIIAVLVLITGYICSSYLKEILKLNLNIAQLEHLKNAFQIALLGITITILSFSVLAINKGVLQTPVSNKIVLFANIAGLGLNILLLFQGFRLLAIAWGMFTNGAIKLIGNGILTYKFTRYNNIRIRFNKKFFKKFSVLFSYTFFSKMGSVLVEKADLIIISRYIGQEAVTAFELTRRPLRISQGFINKTSVSLMPALSNIWGENNMYKLKYIFKKYSLYMIWALVFMGILFILYNEFFLQLWLGDKEIYLGNTLNTLIVLAFILKAVFYNMGNITFSLGNIKGNSTIIIFKSIVYVIALTSLAKFFGLLGVILALMAGILASEMWYYPKKIKEYLNLNLFSYKISFTLIFLSSLIIISYLIKISDIIKIENWLQLVPHAILTVIVYFAIFYMKSKILREDIKNIYIRLTGSKK